MAKTYGPYTRLTRLRRMLGSMANIWRTSDYLLQVSSTGYSENYQRFYFRDIQGFLLQVSNRRSTYNIVLGVCVVPFVIISAVMSTWIPAAIAGALIVLIVLWNTLKGPSCNVFIVTRVQTTRLEAIGRRRGAIKFIQSVQGLIEKAQGDLVTPPPASPETPAEEAPKG